MFYIWHGIQNILPSLIMICGFTTLQGAEDRATSSEWL